RLPGLKNHSPIRIVADSRLRLPMHACLVESAKAIPTWVVTTPNSDGDKKRALEENGVTVIEIAADDNARPDMELLAQELGNRGLTRVLVESGGNLAAALVKLDLVDRLAWFRSPKLIGSDGRGALAAFGIDVIADAPRFTRDSISDVGADVLETYHRAM
ncbi:MAG: RibD family protein, partial [Rhodospirillales bacterium]